MSRILLDHGEGGAASSRLIKDLFLRHLGAPRVLEDAAVLAGSARLAFTTDSFVVRPAVFPGGDIGRLAVCGTVNDLAVMGARPVYLSAGFILEEGLELDLLEGVVISMASTAREAGVEVVTGDTKVVGKGEADGLYINTSGIGFVPEGCDLGSDHCRAGDRVLVSGPIGDHGTAIMVAREGFGIEGALSSDAQPLADLVAALLLAVPGVRCMRDPTRGGLATTLLDFAWASRLRVEIDESSVPVRRPVRSACDLLGLDPLFVACEGRLVIVLPEDHALSALSALQAHPRGREAAIIGSFTEGSPGLVLRTLAGGRRPIIALEGAQLPRIC